MDNRQIKIGIGPENGSDCQKIVFPLNRRVGRIRDVARKWLNKNTPANRVRYEELVCNGIRESLWRVGFDDDLIAAEIEKFLAEVQAEVNRTYVPDAQSPDGVT